MISKYIFEESHVANLAETYVEASKELLMPFPSTPILDFPKFTQLTGGLRPREYSILCGATGVGKTTLMANFSKSLLVQQVPHFVASVETGRTDFVKRMMSVLAREDWNGGDAVVRLILHQITIKCGSKTVKYLLNYNYINIF